MASASADRPAVHIIRTSRFRMTIVTCLELLRALDALCGGTFRKMRSRPLVFAGEVAFSQVN